ncbi:Lrp/AsnC family transcriptional regulator [Streptomyces sp. BI20]|uniref:Lrp/AsnC family transcriptional regulator n=1 Tax=Streptomyces sp. BI20 TaxID=3403460 RepID=UPI003C743A6E
MDALDREILGELRRDARISYRDLGTRVGLSANAAADRVRRMVREGVILGFTTLVDPAAEARGGLVVFVDITLRPGVTNEEFERVVLDLPGITEVVHVTGAHDYLVRARVADPATLDGLLRRLKTEAGVAQSNTRIALRAARRPGGRPPGPAGGVRAAGPAT